MKKKTLSKHHYSNCLDSVLTENFFSIPQINIFIGHHNFNILLDLLNQFQFKNIEQYSATKSNNKEIKSEDDFSSQDFVINKQKGTINQYLSINYSKDIVFSENNLDQESWICWIYDEPRSIVEIKEKSRFPFHQEIESNH